MSTSIPAQQLSPISNSLFQGDEIKFRTRVFFLLVEDIYRKYTLPKRWGGGRNTFCQKIHFAKKNGANLKCSRSCGRSNLSPCVSGFLCDVLFYFCFDCFLMFESFLYFPARKVTDDCISGGHVSHVRKNRRNDARTKRFSTNTWKYHNTKRDKKSSTSF